MITRKRWWIVAVLVLLPSLALLDRRVVHHPPYQSERLQAGGVLVRALRTGAGDTTLFLLHGYGESLLAYRELVEAFARRYRVIAIDLPGSGLSEQPRSYTLDSTVAELSDLLNRSVKGPVVVIGHSMGGEIAAALAIARPDRIVKVVLIAPAGFRLGFGLTSQPFSERQRDLAGWALRARQFVLAVDDPEWIGDPADLPAATRSPAAQRRAAAALLGEFDFTALRDRFDEIRQPTLLIWGRLDPLIPISVGRSIEKELPCARFVEMGNAWHRPHVEQPARVEREILAFVPAPTHCE